LTINTTSTTSHIPIIDERLLRAIRMVWTVIVVLNITLLIGGAIQNIDLSLSQYERILPYVEDAESHRGLFRTLFMVPYVIIGLLAYFVGLAIFLRRSNNRAAFILSLLLISGVPNFSSLSLELADVSAIWAILATIPWVMAQASVYIFLFTFPNGYFYPKFSRYLLLLLMGWECFRWRIYLTDETPSNNLFLVTIALWGIGMVAQVLRYRNKSSRIERQQTKWIVFGAAASVLFYFISIFGIQQLPSMTSDITLIYGVSALSNVAFAGMTIFIVSIALAITKRGLWDIDLTINRSLVYGVVIVFLLIMFAAATFLLRVILGEANDALAYAISAVLAGVLFNPARLRAQHFIDRKFYNLRFDLNELQQGQKKAAVKNPGALTGQTLGEYELLGVIGRGGMGEVYRAHHKNGETVAVKILPDVLALGKRFVQRFQREAATTMTLVHPNIVKMYGSGENDGIYYMAMEFIEGEELKAYMRRVRTFSSEDLADIMAGLTAALDYAHAEGCVHRDIKPSNVMLCLNDDKETYRAVLMDFGVAKIQDAQTNLTGTDAVGTIDYMAPEQIEVSNAVDHRADIYALGVTLYEMMTGERPFKGSPAQVLFSHLQQPAPDPYKINGNIPRHIAKAIMKAMAKDPKSRFQSAGELATALQNVD
jgi:hypothetical protein